MHNDIEAKEIFTLRCNENPQGVITDLVAQTTKQAKAIYDLNNEITRLQGIMKAAGIDPALLVPVKPKKTRAKKETSI